MSRPIITLTTDFGAESVYVAQLKGAILSRAREVDLVDLAHDLPPCDIAAGARFLRKATRTFPAGTIHLAVVDPGVGTSRDMVCAVIADCFFLSPDNGLLADLDAAPQSVIRLTRREFWAAEVSSTFHARDILAPVAAYLALGGDPRRLGDEGRMTVVGHPTARSGAAIHSPGSLSSGEIGLRADAERGPVVEGRIVEIDRFGNLISNITAELLDRAFPGVQRSQFVVRCGGGVLQGLVRTYGDVADGRLIALIGSDGELEIAAASDSAERMLNVKMGARVCVWCKDAGPGESAEP